MDVVNLEDNCIYYIVKDLSEDVRRAGRAAVKSFGVKSRFVHFEVFRLQEGVQLRLAGEAVGVGGPYAVVGLGYHPRTRRAWGSGETWWRWR